MKIDDIWKNQKVPVGRRWETKHNRYKSMHHQFEVIIASLDKISDDLISKGILKNAADCRPGYLELPNIVRQSLKGDKLCMEDTPDNQKIRQWFVKKAKQMHDLEDRMVRSKK